MSDILLAHQSSERQASASWVRKLIEADLMVVICTLPIIYGGVDPVVRLLLGVNAVFLSVLIFLAVRKGVVLPKLFILASTALLIIAVLQVIPLPHFLLKLLAPGVWKIKSPLLGSVAAVDGWMPMAVSPSSAALWGSHITSGIALFFAAMIVSTDRLAVRRLLSWIVFSAAFQVVYALTDSANIWSDAFPLSRKYQSGFLCGTFVNRDHFANYLMLGFGASFGLVAASTTALRVSKRHLTRVLLFSALAVGLGTAVMFSGCRGCVLAGGVALTIGIVMVMMASIRGGSVGLAVLLASVLVSVVLVFAGDALFVRFLDLREAFEGNYSRPAFWVAAAKMGSSSPLFGIGNGSFEAAFPAYELAAGISHADNLTVAHPHCDWIEWFASFGLSGALIGFVMIYAWLRQFGKILKERSEYRRMANCGIAVAVLAFLLHAMVDFPLAIPANASAFAILAGLAIPVTFGVPLPIRKLWRIAVFALLAILLSVWGISYLLHGISGSDLVDIYPGTRPDIATDRATECQVAENWLDEFAYVKVALENSPADPYLWLPLGTLPIASLPDRLHYLERAREIAPSSAYVRSEAIRAAMEIRLDCPSDLYLRIDRLVNQFVVSANGEGSVHSAQLVLRLAQSYEISYNILDGDARIGLLCASFDNGMRDEFYTRLDLVLQSANNLINDSRVLKRLRKAPRDHSWLRFVSQHENSVCMADEYLFAQYLLLLAKSGMSKTATLKSKQFLSGNPILQFCVQLNCLEPDDAADLISLSSNLMEGMKSEQVNMFLLGWDTACRSGRWGTLAMSLERLLKNGHDRPDIALRLADAWWHGGKLEKAASLYEKHIHLLSVERRARLADCYRQLGFVDKLKMLK